MKPYPESGDPGISQAIDNAIVEVACRYCPRSIVIAGGFGRNEASFIRENGRLKALSDCEIALVTDKPIAKPQLAELTRQLTDITGLEVTLSNSLLLRAYARLSVPEAISRRLWRPSIQHYDLKHGSQVVFGSDIRKRLPEIEAGDIPLWEGLRLMFNRMAAALEYYPVGPVGRDRSEAIYWINKVVFACQDALLLSIGRYHPSYKARNDMFRELFPRYFAELNARCPGFLPLSIKATEYKLRPQRKSYRKGITELWSEAAEICDQVLEYIVEKDMGMTFDTYTEFQKKYLRHPNTRGKYYQGDVS